jgi:glyoxylase-like metal-dependent hydrolase (beta-lactamase superfamily II)
MTGNDKQTVEESWTPKDEQLVQQMALSPKVNGLELPFPRQIFRHDAAGGAAAAAAAGDTQPLDNYYPIYNVGYHNDGSFGATPYLVPATVHSKNVWILVDSPRHGKSAVQAVTSVTGPSGPDYMVLTHVDDTADHGKWVEEFPSMKRIFHAGDTGRHNWLRDHSLNNVEILLPEPSGPSPPPPETMGDSTLSSSSSSSSSSSVSPFCAYSLDGTPLPETWLQDFTADPNTNVVILHTPGHSPGSITLWRKPTPQQQSQSQQQPEMTLPGIIFTGDHYGYTTRGGGQMTGFPRFGNNLQTQAQSLKNLLHLQWDIVAPGHGHPRDYTQNDKHQKETDKAQDMEQAIANLHK